VQPPPALRGKEAIQHVRSLAKQIGGQAVIAGTPEQLLATVEGVERAEDLLLLAIDRVLSARESRALSRASLAAVNSGILVWGHEELWPESIGKFAREQIAQIA
jgi:hypothetical protein